MVLLAIPPSELPSTTASNAVVIRHEVAAAGATSSGEVVSFADPLIEVPIEFVPGLEAHPSREALPEPPGSGPFGF